jgi:hypothetical protein
MKKLFIYSVQIMLLSFLSSCNSGDDNSAAPSTNSDNGFISPISQLWEDTAGTKSYFFGEPDSVGRFTGVENDGGQNFLSGKTYRFDISFTVIKDQFSTYVDYAGKLTDTLSTHRRMVVYSKVDTLYLRPQ